MRVEWRLSFSSVMEQLKSCPCSSKQPPLTFVPATLIKLCGWKKKSWEVSSKIGKGLLEKGDWIGEKREGERVVWSKNDPNSGYSCMKLSEWEKGRGSYVQRVGRLWEGKEYYENTLYENLILQERKKGAKEMGGFNPTLTEWNGVRERLDTSTSLISIKIFLLFTQADKQRTTLM